MKFLVNKETGVNHRVYNAHMGKHTQYDFM
jgi:hypothetical protein